MSEMAKGKRMNYVGGWRPNGGGLRRKEISDAYLGCVEPTGEIFSKACYFVMMAAGCKCGMVRGGSMPKPSGTMHGNLCADEGTRLLLQLITCLTCITMEGRWD